MQAQVVPLRDGVPARVAEVSRVAPILDTASGMFRISLNLPNPEHRIPGDTECTVQFDNMLSSGLR